MRHSTVGSKRSAIGGTVLVIGSANMDLVVTCDRFPSPGETRFADSFATYPGGKGANQAVAAAKLDGNVVFLARLGRDGFGDDLATHLQDSGVRVDNVLRDSDAPTGVALITVDSSGENEILVVSGSNMELTPDDVAAQVDLFDDASVVLLQLETPLRTVMAAASMARDRGVAVVLNPAPATELPNDLLRAVDYITPNEVEAEKLSGIPVGDLESARKAAARLIDVGVHNVIVTLGQTGALYVNQDGSQLTSAPLITAVDSTAAGDAFNGAFALALSWGWEPTDAVAFAVSAASFSVTRLGAQPSLPSLSDLSSVMTPEMHARVLASCKTH